MTRMIPEMCFLHSWFMNNNIPADLQFSYVINSIREEYDLGKSNVLVALQLSTLRYTTIFIYHSFMLHHQSFEESCYPNKSLSFTSIYYFFWECNTMNVNWLILWETLEITEELFVSFAVSDKFSKYCDCKTARDRVRTWQCIHMCMYVLSWSR